ncbi:Tn3 family transposase [Streptomyces sp. NPDC002287]
MISCLTIRSSATAGSRPSPPRARWIYLDRPAKQLAADGFPVIDDLLARLSPLKFDHINFLGRYAFFRPQEAGRRPLREPSSGGGDDGER